MEYVKTGERDDCLRLKAPDGAQGWFSFIDLLYYDGKTYAALADEADELCVMELLETVPERYREITDDAVFDAVLEQFARQNPEEFEA